MYMIRNCKKTFKQAFTSFPAVIRIWLALSRHGQGLQNALPGRLSSCSNTNYRLHGLKAYEYSCYMCFKHHAYDMIEWLSETFGCV